jgi:hypothetical protein
MPPHELMSDTFRAWDLATLQEQIDTFVDDMLQRGVQSWTCETWPVLHKNMCGEGPDLNEWHCTVSESPDFGRRQVV